MLIKALCDYYDILAVNGKVLPEGYSKVNIHYLICLDMDGKVTGLINYQEKRSLVDGKGKVKDKWEPKQILLPQRTEKPGIDGNIIEHRPLYIFGLNMAEDILSAEDRTGKAKKSHEAFVKANLEFMEGLESPVINSYRNFLLNWHPEEETENSHLLGLGKDYGKYGYTFCLDGYPDQLLSDDKQVKSKWEYRFQTSMSENEKGYTAQCAVSGEEATIARIHNKIKGIYGGLATGTVLVGFNNSSENSYGNEQSYNSNISQNIMKKYTETLNLLLENNSHKILLDDVTIVFWAMSSEDSCENLFTALLTGKSDKLNTEQTEYMLKSLLENARQGKLTEERLQSLDVIEPEVNFYMLGLKPNSSRLSIKFIYQKCYADILWNIAKFQMELQMSDKPHPVSIFRLKQELISPNSSSEKINPGLLTKLFEAVIYGNRYPTALLETTIRRVKTDSSSAVNDIRAGMIKACLNRNYKKEEFNVELNKENCGQAYVCGRLFAVLEKLQQDASKNSLNRTIKDGYFASAVSKPAIVFPKLLMLAQNHLNKVNNPTFYNIIIGEIMDKLSGEFPENLLLQDQGRFIIGYYQQYQSLFKKSENTKRNEDSNK